IDRIKFINAAARHLHGNTGCGATCERPVVIGFEAEFDHYCVFSEQHVLNDVKVSRKGGDKRTNKLISKSRLSTHLESGKFHQHVVGIKGQNTALIGASPRFVILIDELADVIDGSNYAGCNHNYAPRPDILSQSSEAAASKHVPSGCSQAGT